MKPWIVINAQNRTIGRYVSEEEAIAKHLSKVNAGLVNIQYRPRKDRKVSRTFP